MDINWEQQLADIVKKTPAELTAAEIEFLNSRRSYLNADQLATFADLLSVAPPADEDAAAPAKRAKRGE